MRSGALVTSTMCVPAAGSSSVFSRQFAALTFSRSASSMMITRAGASCGRVAAIATIVCACSMTIWVVSAANTGTSGCRPGVDAAARLAGAAALAGLDRAGQRQRQAVGGGALAHAFGTLEQVRVRHVAGRDRAPEHGRRVILTGEIPKPHCPRP